MLRSIKVSTSKEKEGVHTFSNWIVQKLMKCEMIVMKLLGSQIRWGLKLYRWLMCKKFRPKGDNALQKNKELRTTKSTVWLQLCLLRQNIINFSVLWQSSSNKVRLDPKAETISQWELGGKCQILLRATRTSYLSGVSITSFLV